MKKVQSVRWLNSCLNGLIIHAVVTKGAARPQPWSLWTPTPIGGKQARDPADPPVDYVSWPGLIDRRFTARHLPPADEA